MGCPPGACLLICSEGVSGCITTLAMVRCRASRFIAGFSYRTGQNAFCQEAIRFQGFVVNLAEGGNAVVPFKKRGRVPDALNGAVVKLPDRIDDRMIMGIENVFLVFRMAG